MERWNCIVSGAGGKLAVVLALAVLSAGLWAHGVYAAGIRHMADALLSLFLSRWLGLIALVGMVLISVRLLIRARSTCR